VLQRKLTAVTNGKTYLDLKNDNNGLTCFGSLMSFYSRSKGKYSRSYCCLYTFEHVNGSLQLEFLKKIPAVYNVKLCLHLQSPATKMPAALATLALASWVMLQQVDMVLFITHCSKSKGKYS